MIYEENPDDIAHNNRWGGVSVIGEFAMFLFVYKQKLTIKFCNQF